MLKRITPLFLTELNKNWLLPFSRSFFSRRAKNSQLILHTPEQIDHMLMRKAAKDQGKEVLQKPWKVDTGKDQLKFRVSLVGLPNCGKSSLFNCLIGERVAVVDKQYGTTRDRKQFAILDGLASVIDTPGVEASLARKVGFGGLKQQIFKQTISAIHQSHLILFVIDAKQPLTRRQQQFAKYIKTFGSHCQIVLVCNKCDNFFDEGDLINQTSSLGFKTMLTCSAEEGTGVIELLNYIHSRIPEDMKDKFIATRKKRVQRFEQLIKKLKAEVETYNPNKQFRIKEWENDFRKINPNPETNEDLDQDNYQDFIVKPEEGFSNQRGAEAKNIKLKGVIKICFIGRPNVGKSTLINQIIGEDKLLVSDVAHTTRDAIRSRIQYKGRKVELIDTAGLNTPNLSETNQEYLRKMQISTMLHVQESHVVVYVMDSFESFVVDDFALMRKVIEQGRPVVIAVNKWEAVKEPFRYKARNYLSNQLQKRLGQLHGDPLVFVSGKMNTGIDTMLDKVIHSYDKWNTRISTGLLNDWLQNFKKLNQLPKDEDHSLKINYLIQARVRPPHFIFFVNSKYLFAGNYERFLLRNLAKQFKMDSIPLRLTLRSTNNRQNKRSKPKQRKQSLLKQKMQQLKRKYGNFGQ